MSIPEDITSHYVEVHERKLHYLSAGSGPPILLLHGWPTSAYLWRNVMGPMAKTHQVIALDLPGFGQSSKVPADSFSVTEHARLSRIFMDG